MKLLIIGAGGHGRCCLDIALDIGCFEDIAFLDDSDIQRVHHFPVLGKTDELSKFTFSYPNVLIAIGNNTLRNKLFHSAKQRGFHICSLISPRSFISSSASLGEGCVIFPNVVIESGAKIGNNCIIAANSTINHDACIEDDVLIYSNTVIRPNTVIGHQTRIGSSCVISFGSIIDAYSDIPDGSIINSQEEVK